MGAVPLTDSGEVAAVLKDVPVDALALTDVLFVVATLTDVFLGAVELTDIAEVAAVIKRVSVGALALTDVCLGVLALTDFDVTAPVVT
ncbi:hypothetical protein FKM82_021487 [Ascaphus truei]